MATVLTYLVVMAVIAAVVFLLATWIFGRGEELDPVPAGATATTLPPGPLTGADLRGARFQQVVRGYRMVEVDWVLERAAAELDAVRARLAELEADP